MLSWDNYYKSSSSEDDKTCKEQISSSFDCSKEGETCKEQTGGPILVRDHSESRAVQMAVAYGPLLYEC